MLLSLKGNSNMDANLINQEFVSFLKGEGDKMGFSVQFWKGRGRRANNNILELSGKRNYLIYFKVRSQKPIRWGVTANRIKELNGSGKKWWLVLLFESPHTGYLLNSEDVDQYKRIWPLVKDGDYKVQPGSYLRFLEPFYTFSEFMKNLIE